MIVHTVADGYLEVECDDVRERTLVCNALGVSQDRLAMVRVTFLRSPLDKEENNAKFACEGAVANEQLDAFRA